jgi:serine/threonine protein kinase
MGDNAAMAKLFKPKAGVVVDDWLLESQIGSGGQGHVWAAKYEERHAIPMAIKFCMLTDHKATERFENEIQVLQKKARPSWGYAICSGRDIRRTSILRDGKSRTVT